MSENGQYENEQVEPDADAVSRLRRLCLKLAELKLEEQQLTEKLEKVQLQIRQYSESLVPDTMTELGLRTLETAGGIVIEVEDNLFGSLPKDETKRAEAFRYLAETGNDGLIKQEFVVSFGRDQTEDVEAFRRVLEESHVGERASVTSERTINHQSMMKFLRDEVKRGANVPLAAFGAFTKTVAKIRSRR